MISNEKISRSIQYAALTLLGSLLAGCSSWVSPLDRSLSLAKDGGTTWLDGADADQPPAHIEITTLKPATDDDDTHIEIPQITVAACKAYELFYWDGRWQSLGSRTAADQQAVSFDNLPPNRLYWLVEENSKKLERIFTLNGTRQQWW